MLLVCCRHLICCRFMVDLWIHCTTNWGNGVRAFKNITHKHPFNGPFSGNTQVSRYQKGKPIWILLKQEIVSGNGISWAISKSAPCSRQITMPAPHHSVFYRPDALPATQPTASKHWRGAFKKNITWSVIIYDDAWSVCCSRASCLHKFWTHLAQE